MKQRSRNDMVTAYVAHVKMLKKQRKTEVHAADIDENVVCSKCGHTGFAGASIGFRRRTGAGTHEWFCHGCWAAREQKQNLDRHQAALEQLSRQALLLYEQKHNLDRHQAALEELSRQAPKKPELMEV